MATVRCPYIYKNGKQCQGHVVAIERYHCAVEWTYDGAEGWGLEVADKGTHFHLYCSALNYGNEHNPPVRLWGDQLPDELRSVVFPPEGDA